MADKQRLLQDARRHFATWKAEITAALDAAVTSKDADGIAQMKREMESVNLIDTMIDAVERGGTIDPGKLEEWSIGKFGH